MIDLKETHGKRLGIVAWGKHKDGTDDVAVFTGIAEWDGKDLYLRREGGEMFSIPVEWLERPKPVNEEVKEVLLGWEYCISVTVGNVREGEDMEAFKATGLKWPH